MIRPAFGDEEASPPMDLMSPVGLLDWLGIALNVATVVITVTVYTENIWSAFPFELGIYYKGSTSQAVCSRGYHRGYDHSGKY
jgi:hypothetical protein